MTTVTPVATASAEARSELRDWLEGSRLVSLTTAGSDGLLRSRPLTLLEMDDEARLWFFVTITTPWVTELEPASPANATLIDSTDGTWVSVSGRVNLVWDEPRIEQLWSSAAEEFFIGPSDPDLRLLCLAADSTDHWDARGVSRFEGMARAMIADQAAIDNAIGEGDETPDSADSPEK